MRGRGVSYQEPLPLFSRTELMELKGAEAARDGLSVECCPYIRPTYQLAWLRGYARQLHRDRGRLDAGTGRICRA